MHYPVQLTRFVEQFTRHIDEAAHDEIEVMRIGGELLSQLIAEDNWLPDECAQPHPEYYQQYLLHCDPQERFSVVSFVWGPGQTTPIHDHTVWGLIGMLRGAERGERFELCAPGQPMRKIDEDILRARQVERVSPTLGDIHRVSNVYDDRVSISIHVYGGNIGKIERHVYDLDSGATKTFISGYANATKLTA